MNAGKWYITKRILFLFQALDILVWQLNQTEWDIVCAVLDQLKHSPVWKYRRDAAKMVIHLGKYFNPSK